jgi:hypothetical protein
MNSNLIYFLNLLSRPILAQWAVGIARFRRFERRLSEAFSRVTRPSPQRIIPLTNAISAFAARTPHEAIDPLQLIRTSPTFRLFAPPPVSRHRRRGYRSGAELSNADAHRGRGCPDHADADQGLGDPTGCGRTLSLTCATPVRFPACLTRWSSRKWPLILRSSPATERRRRAAQNAMKVRRHNFCVETERHSLKGGTSLTGFFRRKGDRFERAVRKGIGAYLLH